MLLMEDVIAMQEAVKNNQVLYVAGHTRSNGDYIRDPSSSGCKVDGAYASISEGCLWAPFTANTGKGTYVGTSISTPLVAMSLASIFAVFPETTGENLAKFAKACAKKTGQGIPALLAKAGGVGVADFTCMGTVTGALANLPTGRGGPMSPYGGRPCR